MDGIGHNHIKYIKPVSESQVSCILLLMVPIFYTDS